MFFKEQCKKIKEVKEANISATGNDNNKLLLRYDTRTNTNTKDSEFIYIDLLFENKNNALFQPIRFDCTRNVPIVNNVQDYKLGVISLAGEIVLPIITDYNLIELQMTYKLLPDPNDPTYTVNYTYDIDANHPDRRSDGIYNVETFLFYLNRALTNLWKEVALDFISKGGDWNGDAATPKLSTFLTWDPASQLFTAHSDYNLAIGNQYNFTLRFQGRTGVLLDGLVEYQKLGNNVAGGGTLIVIASGGSKVTVNGGPPIQAVNQLTSFNNVEMVGPLEPPVYVPADPPFNPIPANNQFYYVKTVQDFPSIGRWNKTCTLVLLSDSLPTRKETLAVSSEVSGSSVNTQLNILQTYPLSEKGRFNRITEFSKPNINYCDILGNGPLLRIDFTVKLLDENGNTTSLLCPPRSSIVCKLVLAKCQFTSN